jgi:hypothetical protein
MARWLAEINGFGATTIVDTESGEQHAPADLLVTGDPDAVAGALDALSELGRRVGSWKGAFSGEMERMHRLGRVESAQVYGAVKATRSAPYKWDAKRVESVLERLVKAGRITQERMDALAPPNPKPDGKKLKQFLSELKGEDREALEATYRVDTRWSTEAVGL